MTSKPHRESLWMLGTLGFAALFLFLGLGASPLADWDENIYAEASKQMVERGDYLNVYVNDYPFAEKPPFFFWLQSLSYHAFGINEYAARFPSAVMGWLGILACILFGRRFHSLTFGCLWGLLYLCSLLPSILSKSAVIDHSFNVLILVASFSLYIFDECYGSYLNAKEQGAIDAGVHRKSMWKWLTLGSVCMGIAVLTKGPLGGVIPLVAFGAKKFFYRKPSISIWHFLYCAVISLSIALSWYLVNIAIYGMEFLEGFIEFQLALFSKPLEGHVGPFYYHWLVMIFGLMPWTPLLLEFRRLQPVLWERPHLRALFLSGAVWCIFVLTLFSVTTTKLPHYSASIYIPLSFMTAAILWELWQRQQSWKRSTLIAYLLLTHLVALFLLAIPKALEQNAEIQKVSFEFQWPALAPLTGISLLLASWGSAYFFWKSQHLKGAIVIALGMFFGIQGLWRVQVPVYLSYFQQPMIDMVQEAHEQDAQVVFYRYVSFAALFYGNRPIEMLHTYKFPGDPEILNTQHDQEHWVITETKHKKRIKKEHPLLEWKKDAAHYALFTLPSSTTNN